MMSVDFKTNRDVAIALGRYLVAAYVMGITNEMADARGAALLPDKYTPLPDIGFDVLPFVPDAAAFADAFVSALTALVLLCVFLARRRRDLLCIFIELHMTLMLIRSATVAMTTLPTPSRACVRRIVDTSGVVWLRPVWRILRPHGMSSWCYDLLPSGHSMFYVISAFFLHDAGLHAVLGVIGWVFAAVGFVALICARMHYTVDVAMAVVVAYLIYAQRRSRVVQLFARYD